MEKKTAFLFCILEKLLEAKTLEQYINNVAEELIQNKVEELQFTINALWDNELAEEISVNAHSYSAIDYIEPYVKPEVKVNKSFLETDIQVNFENIKNLHPGLDTLTLIASKNIMKKLQYDRGVEF